MVFLLTVVDGGADASVCANDGVIARADVTVKAMMGKSLRKNIAVLLGRKRGHAS